MFAILRSKVSVASLAFGAVLGVFSTSGKVSAQEMSSISFKAKNHEVGVAGSLLLPTQASKEDMSQDKAIIAFIKRNKHIDFRKLFPSNWEAICLSGEYQDPVRDIEYELGKYFSTCSGSGGTVRDDGIQAITIIWGNRCRVIEVPTSDFYIERQNGTSCYKKESITEFSLQQSPVGLILEPSN